MNGKLCFDCEPDDSGAINCYCFDEDLPRDEVDEIIADVEERARALDNPHEHSFDEVNGAIYAIIWLDGDDVGAWSDMVEESQPKPTTVKDLLDLWDLFNGADMVDGVDNDCDELFDCDDEPVSYSSFPGNF